MPNVRKAYSYVDEWKNLWEPDLEAIGYNGSTCDPTKVDPKVLQWAKKNCAHKPHFVKIIKRNAAHGRPGLQANSSGCLSVPAPFVQKYFRELERVVTLENGEGRAWRVSFGAPGKYPVWSQGWDRVARDNKLIPGDVIVFVLVSNSCFRFKLFDEDGNISDKSTSTQNDAGVFYKKEPSCSSGSRQDERPRTRSVSRQSDPEPEHIKTKKRLLMVSDNPCTEEAENEEHNGAAPCTSLHRHGHVEPNQAPVPAKEQIAEPSCKKRKLQTIGEKFQALNQTVEEGSTSRDESPSNTTVTPTSTNQPQSDVENEKSLQPSPAAQVAPDTWKEKQANKPRLEADESAVSLSAWLPGRSEPQTLEWGPPASLRKEGKPTLMCPVRGTSPLFESLDPFTFTFKSNRRVTTALERQRAGDLARSHAEVLTGQHFTAVMLESHVYRDFHLALPDRFIAASNLPAATTRLKFLDCDGNEWDEYSKKNSCDQFALHRKFWALFALEHLLEEGDVCVFELKANESPRTVLVHIFRVVPISMVDKTSVHAHYETHAIDRK